MSDRTINDSTAANQPTFIASADLWSGGFDWLNDTLEHAGLKLPFSQVKTETQSEKPAPKPLATAESLPQTRQQDTTSRSPRSLSPARPGSDSQKKPGSDPFFVPGARTTDGTTSLPQVEFFYGTPGAAAPAETYLRGPLPDDAWQELQNFRFGHSRELIDQVRREINAHGQDPLKVWTDAIKNGRVLAIGEMHVPGSQQRKAAIGQLAALQKAGATHFAIELPFGDQRAVERAIRTGRAVDDQLDPFFEKNPEILEILKAAHKAGLKIEAVDLNARASTLEILRDQNFSLTRDEYTAKRIDQILRADAKNKVVYWCGGLHSVNQDTKEFTRGELTGLSAAEILKKSHKGVTTLYDQSQFHHQLVSILTADLKTPVAVPTAKAAKMGALTVNPSWADWNARYKDWDYIFIYPHK